MVEISPHLLHHHHKQLVRLMPCDMVNLIGQMSSTANFIVAEVPSVPKKPRLATRSQFFSDQSDDDSHMEEMQEHSHSLARWVT